MSLPRLSEVRGEEDSRRGEAEKNVSRNFILGSRACRCRVCRDITRRTEGLTADPRPGRSMNGPRDPATILLLMMVLTGCAPLPAESPSGPSIPPESLVVTVDERSYSVDGRTLGEVFADMSRRGPTVDGRAAQASTDWSLGWEYDLISEGDLCRLIDVRVTLSMTTTLPYWFDLDHAIVRDARAQWDRFMRDLRTHERGHQDIARDGAAALVQALIQLRGPDCARLSREAQGTAERHRADLQRRQLDFDRVGRLP